MYKYCLSVINIVHRDGVWIIVVARNSHYAIFAISQYALHFSRRQFLPESSHSPCHHANTIFRACLIINVVCPGKIFAVSHLAEGYANITIKSIIRKLCPSFSASSSLRKGSNLGCAPLQVSAFLTESVKIDSCIRGNRRVFLTQQQEGIYGNGCMRIISYATFLA